jgi:hypothetical protein
MRDRLEKRHDSRDRRYVVPRRPELRITQVRLAPLRIVDAFKAKQIVRANQDIEVPLEISDTSPLSKAAWQLPERLLIGSIELNGRR